MRTISRQTSLAEFMWQVDEKAVFAHGDADHPDYFYMSVHAWYDMDKPKKITITVMPGDLLNG